MILLVLIMLVLIIIGMPVAFALGVGALGALLAEPSLPITLVPQRMFTALDSCRSWRCRCSCWPGD